MRQGFRIDPFCYHIDDNDVLPNPPAIEILSKRIQEKKDQRKDARKRRLDSLNNVDGEETATLGSTTKDTDWSQRTSRERPRDEDDRMNNPLMKESSQQSRHLVEDRPSDVYLESDAYRCASSSIMFFPSPRNAG